MPKISIHVLPKTLQILEGVAAENNLDLTDLVNIMIDNALSPESKQEEESGLTFEQFNEMLATSELTAEQITALFMTLSEAMSPKDRGAAAKILENYDRIMKKASAQRPSDEDEEAEEDVSEDEAGEDYEDYEDYKPKGVKKKSKIKGLYEIPPRVEKRPKPDHEGISNELAEELVDSQGEEFMKKDQPKVEEFTKQAEVEFIEEPEILDEEDEEYEYIDEEEDPLLEPIVQAVKKNTQSIKRNGANVSAVGSDDPDNDIPDWEEDTDSIEARMAGINNDAAAKVIEEAPNQSPPVELKKPIIIKYDPRDPKIQQKKGLRGEYDGYKKEVTNKARENAKMSLGLLQEMGVSKNELEKILKG